MTSVYTIPDFGPSDLLTSAVEGQRRVKVEDSGSTAAIVDVYGLPTLRTVALSRTEANIANGTYYAAYLLRDVVGAASTYFYSVSAPVDADVIIDNISPTVSFELAGTGNLHYTTDAFFEESDGNAWTYTGGSPFVKIGRNMNGRFINSDSGVRVSVGGSATPTGAPDFVIGFVHYSLEAQGANRSLTTSEAKFFDEQRRLIVKAGTTVLFRTITTGTITGTFEIQTYVNYYVQPL